MSQEALQVGTPNTQSYTVAMQAHAAGSQDSCGHMCCCALSPFRGLAMYLEAGWTLVSMPSMQPLLSAASTALRSSGSGMRQVHNEQTSHLWSMMISAATYRAQHTASLRVLQGTCQQYAQLMTT